MIFRTTSCQQLYSALYEDLFLLKRAGKDVPGNLESDLIRQRLRDCWSAMIKTEREPFLSPGTLDRIQEGPINRDFCKHTSKRGTLSGF